MDIKLNYLKKKVLRHVKKILFVIIIINERRLVKCDVNNKGSYMQQYCKWEKKNYKTLFVLLLVICIISLIWKIET